MEEEQISDDEAIEKVVEFMRESASHQIFIILWPLAASIKCFDFFLLFKSYRGLYVIIIESVKDSV